MFKNWSIVFLLWFIVEGLCSCEKPINLRDNPFNNNKDTILNGDTSSTDVNSIYSLHKDLFLPTCANSGCHDGNFEPDFRTVESSYLGLVNRNSVKKHNSGLFLKRVVPGKSDESMLLYRMVYDLNGNSGIMPLGLEPNSNYPFQKENLLNRLKNWIDKGAEDYFGNKPIDSDFAPVIKGILVKQNGSYLPRIGIYEPVVAKIGSDCQMFFSIEDDILTANELTELTFNTSFDPNSFQTENEKQLIPINKFNNKGLFGANVDYQFQADITSSQNIKPLDVIWIRISARDLKQKYYIPNEFSMFPLKKYFAIRFQ